MKKGSLIGVDGRIQTRSYDNKEGNRVFVTEVLAENIQFLEPRNAQQDKQQNQQTTNKPFKTQGETIDISDDDLPF